MDFVIKIRKSEIEHFEGYVLNDITIKWRAEINAGSSFISSIHVDVPPQEIELEIETNEFDEAKEEYVVVTRKVQLENVKIEYANGGYDAVGPGLCPIELKIEKDAQILVVASYSV